MTIANTTANEDKVIENIARNLMNETNGHHPSTKEETMCHVDYVHEHGVFTLKKAGVARTIPNLIKKGLVIRHSSNGLVMLTDAGFSHYKDLNPTHYVTSNMETFHAVNSAVDEVINNPNIGDTDMVKKATKKTTATPKKSAEDAQDQVKAEAAAKADKAEKAAAKKAAREEAAAKKKAEKAAERERIANINAKLKSGEMTPQQAENEGWHIQYDYKGNDEAMDPTYNVEIKCADCGETRYIKPQDAFQVKYCKPCMQIRKREKLNAKNRDKRAVKKAEAAKAEAA